MKPSKPKMVKTEDVQMNVRKFLHVGSSVILYHFLKLSWHWQRPLENCKKKLPTWKRQQTISKLRQTKCQKKKHNALVRLSLCFKEITHHTWSWSWTHVVFVCAGGLWMSFYCSNFSSADLEASQKSVADLETTKQRLTKSIGQLKSKWIKKIVEVCFMNPLLIMCLQKQQCRDVEIV